MINNEDKINVKDINEELSKIYNNISAVKFSFKGNINFPDYYKNKNDYFYQGNILYFNFQNELNLEFFRSDDNAKKYEKNIILIKFEEKSKRIKLFGNDYYVIILIYPKEELVKNRNFGADTKRNESSFELLLKFKKKSAYENLKQIILEDKSLIVNFLDFIKPIHNDNKIDIIKFYNINKDNYEFYLSNRN